MPNDGISPDERILLVKAHEVNWTPWSLLSRIRLNSDRGTQYASDQITAFAAANGITRSMGYTGICWDCETINASGRVAA